MKKTYQQPAINVVNVIATQHILAGSEGVTNNSTLGNGYSSTDVSYSRNDGYWDDED